MVYIIKSPYLEYDDEKINEILSETVDTSIDEYGILTVTRECFMYDRYIAAAEAFDATIVPELFVC